MRSSSFCTNDGNECCCNRAIVLIVRLVVMVIFLFIELGLNVPSRQSHPLNTAYCLAAAPAETFFAVLYSISDCTLI